MTPLRVGLAGAGWVTQHHLEGWRRERARAQVVAICDPDIERAQARARAFGIDQVFRDAAEMLAHARLDALDVAAPREAHAALVRLAAAHTIPVLCQKPLAPTMAEASRLVGDVEASTRLMVHENWRFRPCYRQIRQWLAEGRIGAVQQAQMTLLSSGLVADAEGRYPALVRQPFVATLQRALVSEILIHHIDTLRFLLGELQLVHASLGRSCPAMRGEDRATALFETAARAPVVLMANLGVHGEPAALVDRLVLVGERGTIRLSGELLRCEGHETLECRHDSAQGYADSYAAAISHFIDGLLQGGEFETGPSDNLRTLALVESVYERGGAP
jgi:predicted dehydrogenase